MPKQYLSFEKDYVFLAKNIYSYLAGLPGLVASGQPLNTEDLEDVIQQSRRLIELVEKQRDLMKEVSRTFGV